MQHQRRPQQPADSSIHVWRSEGAGMIWMQKPQKRDLEPVPLRTNPSLSALLHSLPSGTEFALAPPRPRS